MRTKWILGLGVAVLVAASAWLLPSLAAQSTEKLAVPATSRLAVVWTSGDREIAHRVCLMYTHAARKSNWFAEVRLVVWGPSAKLLAGDKDLQEKIKAMMADGVVVQACIVCADSYGVTESLRSLGIEVKAMGQPLTQMLKDGYKVLTF